MTQQTDPYAASNESALALLSALGVPRLDAAVVLGSGWAGASDALDIRAEVPLESLPGFARPVVAGHGGTVRLVFSGADRPVALFNGRTHLYEGLGVAPVVHGVRTAAAAGARTLVLTNGCGGIHPDFEPGTPVLLSDHINLTGTTPLVGPRFIDMTEPYSARLRGLARGVDPTLPEGVYAQFHGPSYETPAEVRMARAVGADLVGMSTVLECIAARELGLDVLGISLVTNRAAGLAERPLSHAEVMEAGNVAIPRLQQLLAGLLRVL